MEIFGYIQYYVKHFVNYSGRLWVTFC